MSPKDHQHDQIAEQQVVALGRLGWSLRRIAAETRVHRETAGEYLRAAGVPVRGRGVQRHGSEKAPYGRHWVRSITGVGWHVARTATSNAYRLR